MGKGMNLRGLAAKAGRWLGLAPRERHASAVAADRFDEMSWQETYSEARALRTLADELQEHHDHAADLLRDIWTAAFKADPVLRPRGEMDAGRLVNHRVIGTLLESDDFTELRRHTVGDAYAAAMAVLAQADAVRRALEQTREEQQAGSDARDRAGDQDQAAAAVAAALADATAAAGEDGELPAAAGEALAAAIAAAEEADSAADTARAAAEAAADATARKVRGTIQKGARDAAADRSEEEELMAAWGIGPGQLERMPFQERQALAERLKGTRLVRFAKLMGRFRTMAEGERARKVERVPGELVGLTLGGDVSRVVADDLANLAVPALRALWLARWADSRLLEYETRGDDRVGLGAVIACIDTSGSMLAVQPDGASGNAWAKGCALALLDQARAERRAFAGILFSSASEIKTFRFPAGQVPAVSDVIDFVEFSFNGGTDFETPLSAAVDLLAQEYDTDGKAKGDIVLISDDECGVSEQWTAAWLEAKARLAFRLFGIAVARRPGLVMEALCDNARSVDDLTAPDAARELFGLI
jgi:uncharacterized protein with von Willebrand factor type A (vWA) domain